MPLDCDDDSAFASLSPSAECLYWAGIRWCRRALTAGVIPVALLKRQKGGEAVEELLASELCELRGSDVFFTRFPIEQQTPEETKRISELQRAKRLLQISRRSANGQPAAMPSAGRQPPRDSEIQRSENQSAKLNDSKGKDSESIIAAPSAPPSEKPKKAKTGKELPRREDGSAFTAEVAWQIAHEACPSRILPPSTESLAVGGLRKRFNETIRAFPTDAQWRMLGEHMASGGVTWLKDKAGATFFVTPGIGDAFCRAKEWAATGRKRVVTVTQGVFAVPVREKSAEDLFWESRTSKGVVNGAH